MHKGFYDLPKIWCSYRSKHNAFVLDETNDYIGLTNTTVIFGTNQSLSLKYLLALLNSRLLNFRYRSIGKQTGSGVFEYFANGVGKLPIPVLDLSPKTDKDKHDKFVSLVDQMLILKKKEQAETLPQMKIMIGRQIQALDRQIDTLVYRLFGLTEDEVKVVEGDG
jgi:hypothetical protein